MHDTRSGSGRCGGRREVPLGDDAIVGLRDRRLHFEFYHLSEANCNPNKIARYMMKKLRVYATQYNLIEV